VRTVHRPTPILQPTPHHHHTPPPLFAHALGTSNDAPGGKATQALPPFRSSPGGKACVGPPSRWGGVWVEGGGCRSGERPACAVPGSGAGFGAEALLGRVCWSVRPALPPGGPAAVCALLLPPVPCRAWRASPSRSCGHSCGHQRAIAWPTPWTRQVTLHICMYMYV
jgi:hypothetical protein